MHRHRIANCNIADTASWHSDRHPFFCLLTVYLCRRTTASSTEVSTTVQTTCWGTGFPLLWSSMLNKSLFVSQVLATDYQYNHNDKAQWAENSLEQSITIVLFWECGLACELHSLYQQRSDKMSTHITATSVPANLCFQLPPWFLCIPKCENFATITPFAQQSFQALLSKSTWNIWAKEKSVNFLKGSYDTKQSMFHDWLNCKNTYCIRLFVQWFSNIHMKQEKKIPQ